MTSSAVGLLVCAVLVVLALVNLVIMGVRASRDEGGSAESRKRAYRKIIFLPFLIYVPFMYAGVALATGFAESPSEFFDTESPSRALLVFHLLIAVCVVAMVAWVWFFGGFQLLLAHPMATNLPRSEPGMKLFWGAITAFAAVMIGYMLFVDLRWILK